MLKRFTNACVKMVDRYLPDPFLFAIILTLFIFGAACVFTGTPEEAYADRALRTLKYWGDFKNGFWNLLKFSMQTSMIVVFGSTLAKTPLFTKLINSLAGTVSTEAGAIILTTVVSSVFSWLNYGLGLIVGALLGKAIAKRIKVDYPLLIAAAYSGFVIWHQGLSGSIPLTISTGFKVGNMNVVAPITDTIFNQWNLITVVACIIVLCIVNVAMRRDPDKAVYVDPSLFKEDDVKVEYKIETPADRMEHSKILWLLTVILGWAFLFFYFKGYADSGKSVLNGLGRDSVNFFLLFAGLLLHGDLRRYVDALKSSVSSVAGVILQYPFYAGIMAIMVGVDSQGQSLAVIISNFFVQHATKVTFPFLTFISAGVVNFLVPSGGGQWAVQAPIVMDAAAKIGVPQGLAAMAIAFGDQWTNMIQPFWALPALAVAGLRAKDIMGFMVVVTIATGIVFGVGIFCWALFI